MRFADLKARKSAEICRFEDVFADLKNIFKSARFCRFEDGKQEIVRRRFVSPPTSPPGARLHHHTLKHPATTIFSANTTITSTPHGKCRFDFQIRRRQTCTFNVEKRYQQHVEADKSEGLACKEAGVDIDAGSELVRRIAKMAPGIGGFGGLFPLACLSQSYRMFILPFLFLFNLVFFTILYCNPIIFQCFTGDSYLVAGTDGVGTRLKLAFETGIHETIGIDLVNIVGLCLFFISIASADCNLIQVAMSVNDIVTSGAKPLFFLDYFATSRVDVALAEKVIKGIVDGCQQFDCALLGEEVCAATF
ncbi:hypothetical protein BUALT_BualtUnG0024900 [Buddleja alternifolia]|uniref:PurM-like N-terminal domain-containing protein n=1 Tax=Buddleja alternifolia TaxID=168488 RepID=A0AAV6W0G9_9LAMI|nr:hypothetical protein BUALT_BualtUnG0024900 [Buddleja alternifolia]